MNRLTLKVKQDCKGNICPMPLRMTANTIKGLKLVNYDEKTYVAEFEYDDSVLSRETVIAKLKEKKYKPAD